MKMPRSTPYYQRGNSANAVMVEMDNVTLWFSYSTLVAFHVEGQRRVVHENQWGPTTGKHLNAIDGGTKEAKANRVKEAEFHQLWQEQMGCVALTQ